MRAKGQQQREAEIMCRSLDEGGRRCKAHGSFKEIPDDADAWLEDHPPVPTGKAVTVRVSESDARQIADAPGLLLAARITAPVEEEPFAAGSYLQRSGEQVPAHADPLSIKRNFFLKPEQLEALREEAEVIGLPTSTLAQMKVAGADVYAHAPSMKKQAREDREAWMRIPRADREALVKERSAAEAEVQAAEADAALLARVADTVAQGEAALAARRAELEALIILKQGREGAYESVGEAIRERKLLTLNLESIREERKQADRALQVASAKRQETWNRALVLMQLAVVVLPPRTRPFSNAFIMGFTAVAHMRAGAR